MRRTTLFALLLAVVCATMSTGCAPNPESGKAFLGTMSAMGEDVCHSVRGYAWRRLNDLRDPFVLQGRLDGIGIVIRVKVDEVIILPIGYDDKNRFFGEEDPLRKDTAKLYGMDGRRFVNGEPEPSEIRMGLPLPQSLSIYSAACYVIDDLEGREVKAHDARLNAIEKIFSTEVTSTCLDVLLWKAKKHRLDSACLVTLPTTRLAAEFERFHVEEQPPFSLRKIGNVQVEAVLGVVGAKAGFKPLEAVDAVLGVFGIDIMDDDEG